MSYCILIPAFNEGEHIEEVVRACRSATESICVVDDGSSDATARKAWMAGAYVLTHHHNMGVGAAIATGLRALGNTNYDFVVIMAGDAQHRIEDLGNMLSPLLHGTADFVQGTRYDGFGLSTPNGRPLHRLGPLFMSLLFRICTGRWFLDPGNGFKAFKLSLFKNHDLSQEWLHRFSLEPALLYWAATDPNVRVIERKVTIDNYPKSTLRPWKLWKDMIRAPILLRLGIKR